MVKNTELEKLIEDLTKSVSDLSISVHDGFSNLKKTIDDNQNDLVTKLASLTTRLDDVEKDLEAKTDLIAANEEGLKANAQSLDTLTKRITYLEEQCKKNKNIPSDIKIIEELLEDRTNRQLRETLVFQNVPETSEKESYEVTKDLLAELIADNIGGQTKDSAKLLIKRAHRESPRNVDNPNATRKGKRLIFAAFHSWDLCEEVKEVFRRKCIQDVNFNISVDQKYGPRKSKRRKMAFDKRKELRAAGTVSSAFIDFPARLMVNYTGEFNNMGKEIYKLHEDFSRRVVT